MRALRNVRTTRYDRRFVVFPRQPCNGRERYGENTFRSHFVEFADHPLLAYSTSVIDPAGGIFALTVWFVKYNGTARTPLPKNSKRGESAERKPAPRPGERRILQKNPMIAPPCV